MRERRREIKKRVDKERGIKIKLHAPLSPKHTHSQLQKNNLIPFWSYHGKLVDMS